MSEWSLISKSEQLLTIGHPANGIDHFVSTAHGVIVLMTFSFQAPGFYEKNGFTVVARIDDHPSGHRNLLMHKVLAPGRFASWRPHPSAANTPNENVASVPGQPPWRSHDDGSH